MKGEKGNMEGYPSAWKYWGNEKGKREAWYTLAVFPEDAEAGGRKGNREITEEVELDKERLLDGQP